MQLNPPATPQELGDAIATLWLGGEPHELVTALRLTAAHTIDEEARGRLQRGADVLAYAGEVHAAMQAELNKGLLGQ